MKIKIINIAIIILILLNIAVFTNIYFLLWHNYLPEKQFTPYNFNCEFVEYEITQAQAEKLASECVGLKKFSVEYSSDFSGNVIGKSNMLTHYIKIADWLTPYEQLPVLVHEMVHIKYYTANERFTEYKTFRLMYESENEILHNVGLIYGQKICSIDKGEYDCSYYIVAYLQKNEYNISRGTYE